MGKLIHKREKNNYFPDMETWQLDNGINVVISFYEKEYILAINSESGDITDQVFKELIKHEKYKSIKLEGRSRYFLNINTYLLKDILNIIEKINVSILDNGKSY